MSRAAPLRRSCPPTVAARIEDASTASFCVVQELGPLSFILRPSTDHTAEDRTEERAPSEKIKVGLGALQTCTCSVFAAEGELCVHILWVLLKIFRVPPESEFVYQLALVDREIAEVLIGRKKKVGSWSLILVSIVLTELAVLQKISVGHSPSRGSKISAGPAKANGLEPRSIEENDVCPICQELLLEPQSPLTHCRLGCGNSLHIKCVKVLMDHHTNTLGLDRVKCPVYP
ncbi:hypothetical protein BDK51DRAFT_16435 [Blyttiomyces helicus]|uniref:SWIM-type domain-containing protein n=1 Tax=Blyttiomyces helicus TaxID=388810 RepID=A0A4P9W8A7_9FUNG|nr:hypothetical protein BDK51DRAFT_16435 [Blyttiomyces helicus]|eukprot:RKO87683.1 hypothetical protein BDK51DRAFT_16435 [Blyttiomyces helicus]